MNDFVLNLIEGTVSLYPADATGAPLLGSPVFLGAPAENLRVRRRWLKASTKPTGARYPRNHPLVAQYEISIDRVWMLPRESVPGLIDYGRYVLDVTWVDEDLGNWHRRTFYGVTISEEAFDNRDVDGGFTDGTSFDAEYVALDGGPGPVLSVVNYNPPTNPVDGGGNTELGGTIPPISPLLPYVVTWVGASGSVDLYRYDSVTRAYVPTPAGLLQMGGGEGGNQQGGEGGESEAGEVLALITATADALTIQFGGYQFPALTVDSAGVLTARALELGKAPKVSDLPRLDFNYGGRRVASVTADGRVFGVALQLVGEPILAVPGGGFALVVGSAPVAVLTMPVVLAGGIKERIFPMADVGGTLLGDEGGGLIGAEG